MTTYKIVNYEIVEHWIEGHAYFTIEPKRPVVVEEVLR